MGKYIHRHLEPVLASALKQFPAIAVTGPRQSGKSTLLRQSLPSVRYVTLDDPVLRQRVHDDPELFLGEDGQPMIIDEIQYAPDLLHYIKMRIDRNREKKGRFILTGSQQFVLMKNLGESLAGRIGLLELLPFGIGELMKPGDRRSALTLFIQACLRGLYPELAVDTTIDVVRWHASYMQIYLERDIRGLYDIGNLREFERFLRLLAVRCAQELNLSSLATDVGVSVNTLKKWVSILEACRIIFLLPPYYRNLGKRIIKAPKVYFLDLGMVCYLTGIREKEHLLNGPMAGALFENFCIQEAVKVMCAKGVPPRLYYVKTSNGLEVDLLAEGVNGRLCPFEFKLSKTPRPHMGDAMTRFADLFKELNPEAGTLVSLADREEALTRTVRLVPLAVFLDKMGELAVL